MSSKPKTPIEMVKSFYVDQASPLMSDNYQVINSEQISDVLKNRGWELTKIKSANSKSELKQLFGKHVMIFENHDIKNIKDYGGLKPQILITNSHDGSTSLRLNYGLFRLICTNGLVVGNSYYKENLRHTSNVVSDLDNRIIQMVEGLDGVWHSIEDWSSKTYRSSAKNKFALETAKLVLSTNDVYNALAKDGEDMDALVKTSFDVNALLRVNREADDRLNVWSLYNTVQENVMKRNYSHSFNFDGKMKTARSNENWENTMAAHDFNLKLWDLANNYLAN